MTTIMLFIIWIMIPAIIVFKNAVKIRKIKLELEHSRILYSFCEVRDFFAMKALHKEISEDSEMFRFFYVTNSAMIHNHPEFGKCFVSMIRDIYKKKTRNNKAPEDTGLAKELRQADDESKAAAMKFIHAYTKALFTAMPYVLIDFVARKAGRSADIITLKILAKNPFSSENRKAANFGMALARAACV